MNTAKIAILAGAILTFSSGIAAQGYDLNVREDSCGQNEENFLSLYNKSGGNAAEPGYYKWQVCGSGMDEVKFQQSCGGDLNPILYLPEKNNSHVFSQEEKNWKVCASITASINNSCREENIIISMAKEDDSHTGAPNELSNQLCASDRSVETVSLKMDLPSDTNVYMDGNSVSEGTYSASEIDYPYIVSNQPSGIVSFGELESISYSETATENILEVKQTEGSFLLPNTRGGYTEIEDEEEDVKSRSFLERVNPSFAYAPVEAPAVRVIYKPNVKVEGFEGRVEPPVEIYSHHKINSGSEPEVELGLN